MILVLSFLAPDAIVATPIELVFMETEERIAAVITRAIVGYTANGKTPRVFGTRSGILSQIKSVRNNSGIIGK